MGLNPAPSAAVTITEWVAYTPTFTGFGATPSSIQVVSRRVGDSLEISGRFTSDTPTGVEGRISLGFNGTNGNVTSAGTGKIPAIKIADGFIKTSASSSPYDMPCLIEPSVGYITFSNQGAGALNKRNASDIFTAVALTFFARVPINGWTA